MIFFRLLQQKLVRAVQLWHRLRETIIRRGTARRRLFASKLAIQVQLKVLYLEVSGRTSSLLQYSYMMPKTINIGQWWDTTHATEAPPTIDLSSSRKFWCSPMVSSPLSHVRLFSLAFFCSASTQTVLTHTVGSNRVQRSLAVEALNHWTTYKDHASVSYVQFKGRKTHSRRYDNDIDTEHEIETHHTSLAFYGYAHFSWSRALYVAVTWKLNPNQAFNRRD